MTSEAMTAKPEACLVGLDFNYRSTLWTPAQAREVMTPIVAQHVDLLVTTIEDMARVCDPDGSRLFLEAVTDLK